MEDPDTDAFHYIKAPPQPTYRVYFWQKDLWEGFQVAPHTEACRVDRTLNPTNFFKTLNLSEIVGNQRIQGRA